VEKFPFEDHNLKTQVQFLPPLPSYVGRKA
jgi:hypothetical protein